MASLIMHNNQTTDIDIVITRSETVFGNFKTSAYMYS